MRNVKRLERLTSYILDVSRIESNALKLNVEIIDLNKNIRIAVNDEISAVLNGKELEIIFNQRESTAILIKGDNLRLVEVLSNILDNGINFTDSGGKITVIAEKLAEKNEALVSIEETGKGIDRDSAKIIQ